MLKLLCYVYIQATASTVGVLFSGKSMFQEMVDSIFHHDITDFPLVIFYEDERGMVAEALAV